MEETIDLREIFSNMRKRFWIIALISAIAIVSSAITSFFILEPIYQTNTTLIVSTDNTGEISTITGDQFSVTQKLAVTYGEIIKSRTVLEPVIKNLKLDITFEELTRQVTVLPVKDTQIISISVQNTNPNKARDIANEIPKIFKKEARRITKANSIEVIDKAVTPLNPIKPNKIMNILIAAVLGIMIGTFVVFLIEYLDNKIKTPQDIEKHIGLAILGVILKEGETLKSIISEAYKGIRTNIEFSNVDKEIKIITVTSSIQNEGKTTVISNLAKTFASLEKKVLILDGDLRNPSVHRMFGISNIQGLTDVLVSDNNFLECVHETDIKNLNLLTCGPIPPNPSEVLASKKMKDFVESLKEYYDYIFIDAPPIGIVTDAGIISTYSDGVVFVVGSQEADIEMVKVSKERLENVEANILGVVLNKFDVKSSGYYDYYYQGVEEKSKKKKSRNKRENKYKYETNL